MPLIECKLGYTEKTILSTNYYFNENKDGKFVAMVHDPDHVAIFLSVTPYRLAEDEAEADPVPVDNSPPNREGYEITHETTAQLLKLPQQRGRRRGRG